MKNKKSFVYKLYCDGIDEVYIGSSKNTLCKRYGDHKYNCNNKGCPKYNQSKYKFIRENGGFDKWKMEVLEEYINIDEIDLLLEEKKHIENYEKVLNERLPIKFYT